MMLNIIILQSVITLTITFLILINRKFFLRKYRFVDLPNKKRKVHKKPISNVGGFACFVPFIFSIFLSFKYENIFSLKFYIIILILSFAFFSLGKIDDDKSLSAILKTFIFFFLFLSIFPLDENFILKTLDFKFLNFKFILGDASVFFTLFCVFIFYNTLNFLDGFNGIFASVTIYWLLILIFISGLFSIILFSLLISVLLFLYFNLNNKVFIGNSGNSFFSIILSSLYIYSYNLNNQIYCDEIFFTFIIPGIDTVRVSIQRLIKGKSPLVADQTHLHHILANRFKKNSLWIIYIIITMIPLGILNLSSSFIISLIASLLIYSAAIMSFRKNSFKKIN